MKTISVRNFFCLAVFGLLPMLTAPSAGSATFTMIPSADAFVTTGPSGNLALNNYGGAGALSVAAGGLAQGEFQSVLLFSLSSAKAAFDAQYGTGQWTLQSVTLQLTAGPPNNSIFNSSAAGRFSIDSMQNHSWVEGTGTPTTPTTTGITFGTVSNFVSGTDETLGTFGFNGATNGVTIYNLGLTPNFATEILTGGSASLRMYAADNGMSMLVDSRSFNSASARPVLTLTAVPEPGPAAFGLLAAVFGLLAGGRWRAARE